MSAKSANIMARVEPEIKEQAEGILEQLGLSLPAYLRMCMARLNQENGIPFSMKLETRENKGISALERATRIAEEHGIADMTLEEINAEIAEARK